MNQLVNSLSCFANAMSQHVGRGCHDLLLSIYYHIIDRATDMLCTKTLNVVGRLWVSTDGKPR